MQTISFKAMRLNRTIHRFFGPRAGTDHADEKEPSRVNDGARPIPSASLPLTAYATGQFALQFRPGVPKRGWMDETESGFANRCLPLLIANQWGWFILNDRRIELKWNGGLGTADLHIHYWRKKPDEQIVREDLLAVSHFGHGILTWRIPYLLRTPPGWNLYVRGPTNWCKDGACPLDGVVEADWSSATFTMNWKITRKDSWISFEEGEPICMIFPVARGSVEAFAPQIQQLFENPELERHYREWKRSREEFSRANHQPKARLPWQKHYFRGTSLLGEIFPGHQTKLAICGFRDVRKRSSPISSGPREGKLDG